MKTIKWNLDNLTDDDNDLIGAAKSALRRVGLQMSPEARVAAGSHAMKLFEGAPPAQVIALSVIMIAALEALKSTQPEDLAHVDQYGEGAEFVYSSSSEREGWS